MTGFPQALKNAEWTGNPVRAEIAAIATPGARFAGRTGPLKVLVVGGSLGAQALNESVPKALALMHERPQVVHQAAEAARRTASNYADAGVNGELAAFIDDMARRYAEADLVICRAGAMTVAELSAGGVASILVPFPHAVDDHQTANAKFLADTGGAADAAARPDAAGLAQMIQGLDRAERSARWRARRARSASPSGARWSHVAGARRA